MSVFVAFYAYKGGTGRTLTLVHTAWALAREGRRVVLIDLDLAAPSLWPLLGTGEPVNGFVELVADWQEGKAPSVEQYLQEVPLDSKAAGALYVMSAGRMDERYLTTLEGLDWQHLMEPRRVPSSAEQQDLFEPGVNFFDFLKSQLQRKVDPDAVFIDAPTGLSDTANVCLRLLADVVSIIFTPTRVQLEGVGRVVGLLTSEQQLQRATGSEPSPDVFCVASTLMSRRVGGAEMKRIQEAFSFLDRIRFEALGEPSLAEEETADLVEQAPAVISYDSAIADLERIDTATAPGDAQVAVYHDVLRYLRQCVPPRQHRIEARGPLKGDKKRAVLDDLAPRFEQFAERETEKLEMYFLRSTHVDRLREPIVVVILGGKGAGKTALFSYSTRTSHPHADDKAVHGSGSGGVGPDILVEIERRAQNMDVFWRVYCLVQCGLLPPQLPPTVVEAVQTLERFKTGAFNAEDMLRVLSADGLAVDIDRAWMALDAEREKQKQRLVLHLDGLDTAFKNNLEQRRRGLAALFVAWQATFSKLRHIDLKVFMRSDLWEQLSFPEKSHLKTRTMQLSWAPEDLWRLVLKRALHSQEFTLLCKEWGIEPQLEADTVEASSSKAMAGYLDALFEPRIWAGKNSLSRNWVMRRLADAKGTIFPRDVLCLLFEAIREERDRIRNDARVAPEAVISRESLAKALLPTSTQRVEALSGEYPELLDVLELLKGLPANGKTESLRIHFAQRQWTDVQPVDALEKAGVLMIEKDSYSVPALYLHGLRMFRPGPT
jgi:Mrp family chromosome partitioning ATPase